jgi:hypothetical protein
MEDLKKLYIKNITKHIIKYGIEFHIFNDLKFTFPIILKVFEAKFRAKYDKNILMYSSTYLLKINKTSSFKTILFNLTVEELELFLWKLRI